jgi:hypothetical protein
LDPNVLRKRGEVNYGDWSPWGIFLTEEALLEDHKAHVTVPWRSLADWRREPPLQRVCRVIDGPPAEDERVGCWII